MALQRFTRRAAEALRGTGEAKDTLPEMSTFSPPMLDGETRD
jgi:hypothetical protein